MFRRVITKGNLSEIKVTLYDDGAIDQRDVRKREQIRRSGVFILFINAKWDEL